MSPKIEAEIYVHAGDVHPTIKFAGAAAEAIKRDFPKGGLIPAHQLAQVLRWAGEHAAAQALFDEEEPHVVRVVLIRG